MFRKIQKETAVSYSLFHVTLIKRRLWHRLFFVNIAKLDLRQNTKANVCKCFLKKVYI